MAQENHRGGSEDNSEALQHVRNAQQNADALADQARRVEASAPDGTRRAAEGPHVPGMGGEDNTRAAENVRSAQENRDALEAQARRVDATTPDGVSRTGPRDG